MLSLQFTQILFTGLLPFFSTLVAGIARQDRAPAWLNDFISFVTPLGAGVINAAANGAQANSSGLLFLTVSTLLANLSHAPFLYSLQQELQSKVLSLGVKPAQLQAVEHAAIAHMPQMEALLMQLIEEVRGSRAQAVPSSSVGATSMSGQPMQNLTLTASALPPTVIGQPPVPQQPFPASSLHWGDTGVVPAQK